jgi:hypothetical protein
MSERREVAPTELTGRTVQRVAAGWYVHAGAGTCGYANLVTINYDSSIFGQSTPSCSQSNIWDKSN